MDSVNPGIPQNTPKHKKTSHFMVRCMFDGVRGRGRAREPFRVGARTKHPTCCLDRQFLGILAGLAGGCQPLTPSGEGDKFLSKHLFTLAT
eukprot:4918889-Amphidinium_carterae.1